jgi:hypothetical protein
MTLNSTGLGVGVSPSYKLDVNGVARVNSGGDGLFLSAASSPDLYIVGTNYYNNNGTEGVQVSARPSWKIEHKNSSDALAYLDIGFRAASAAASAFTSRFKIDGSGNVGIGVTPSAGKGCLQLSSGINFPATQVASSDANTLDDYIERTWTGTLKGSVSDPTTPVTATGRITKIGRKVMAEITFSNVSTVGASGAISITGLPYTNNASVNGVGIASLNLIGTFTGSPVSFITIGGSTIELYADVSNGASTQITHNAGVARFMTIQITYTV